MTNVPAYIKHGILAAKYVEDKAQGRRLLKSVTDAQIYADFGIDRYKDNDKVSSEIIFKGGERGVIPMTEAAARLILKQGHMKGIDVDHVNEAQDIYVAIKHMSDDEAVEFAYSQFKYCLMLKSEHNAKTAEFKRRRNQK